MARPKIEIDAKLVAKKVAQGAKVTEIADFFEVSTDTIYRNYAAQLAKGRGERNLTLREYQFNAAAQGNSTMLVWLGKQYLGQTDNLIDQHLLEAIQRAGISKNDLLEMVENKKFIESKKPKVTYEQFMENGGYPKPFKKQLEMRAFLFDESGSGLLLGSRGYGKTDYGTIGGTAYDIYMNPMESTNLIMTKSRERNAAMLREIENLCVKNGMVFDQANATSLRVSGLQGKDHSVSAVTIKTVTLRGRHPKRVIMDDPVTEDDTSDATRTVVEKKYNEINKLTSNIKIIGQPAHKYDLYAKLRGIVKTMEVPHGSIPELDHDLEAQRLAGVDEKSIQASYFLKILSEGATPFDNIKYIDKFPIGDSSVAWIDPSFKGGDDTALTILKGHFDGIAAVGFMWNKAWNHCLDDMLPLLIKYKVKKLAIECNSLGTMPVEMLGKLLQGKGIGVVGQDSSMNKHSKIMAAGAHAHLIHMAKDSHAKYIKQVVQYEYDVKYDDAPDSLASCMAWIGLIRGVKK